MKTTQFKRAVKVVSIIMLLIIVNLNANALSKRHNRARRPTYTAHHNPAFHYNHNTHYRNARFYNYQPNNITIVKVIPKGIKVKALPSKATEFAIGDKIYYEYNGVYYIAVGKRFKVVDISVEKN